MYQCTEETVDGGGDMNGRCRTDGGTTMGENVIAEVAFSAADGVVGSPDETGGAYSG